MKGLNQLHGLPVTHRQTKEFTVLYKTTSESSGVLKFKMHFHL